MPPAACLLGPVFKRTSFFHFTYSMGHGPTPRPAPPTFGPSTPAAGPPVGGSDYRKSSDQLRTLPRSVRSPWWVLGGDRPTATLSCKLRYFSLSLLSHPHTPSPLILSGPSPTPKAHAPPVAPPSPEPNIIAWLQYPLALRCTRGRPARPTETHSQTVGPSPVVPSDDRLGRGCLVIP